MMIRDYFNSRASTWDSHAAEKDEDKLRNMAARLGLKAGMTVLDVGAGTGVFLPYLLAGVGPKGQVLALDVAERMLLEARSKWTQRNVHYICSSVTSIPLKDGACHAVVCYSSFPHFPNKPRALVEMGRVLAPGGRVFIRHTSGREKINQIHGRVPLLSHHLLPDAIEMAGLLRAAGLGQVEVEETANGYFAAATAK